MQREIDEWIENNNPYGKEHPCKNCSSNIWNQCQINHIDCERYKELINIKGGWAKGAKDMAEHLTSQPPTKEQLIKVFDIYHDNNKEFQTIDARDFDEIAEMILKNWNNE